MDLSRKSFLKYVVSGSLGAMTTGSGLGALAWRDRGVQLTSVQRSSLVMGSVIQFEVIADRREAAEEAIRQAVAMLRDLDQKLSMYDTGSEMNRVGRAAGRRPLAISPDSQKVLHHARDLFEWSGGMFDVTLEPAMQRWGFRNEDGKPIERPTDRELRRLEELTGMDKLVLEDGEAYLEIPGMGIDLGGIAGGYALDRAIERMKSLDVASAFINFAGDIHCFGDAPEQQGWPVYLVDPVADELMPDPVILENQALSTSGSYQNRRGNGEQSWGHLLRPDGLQPVEPVSSFTAIHDSALQADGWSTAGYLGAQIPDAVRAITI